MKLLQVTSIEYDFQCDDETVKVSENFQRVFTSQTIGEVYEVESEDELADVISDKTGWCVKSVNYVEL